MGLEGGVGGEEEEGKEWGSGPGVGWWGREGEGGEEEVDEEEGSWGWGSHCWCRRDGVWMWWGCGKDVVRI